LLLDQSVNVESVMNGLCQDERVVRGGESGQWVARQQLDTGRQLQVDHVRTSQHQKHLSWRTVLIPTWSRRHWSPSTPTSLHVCTTPWRPVCMETAEHVKLFCRLV